MKKTSGYIDICKYIQVYLYMYLYIHLCVCCKHRIGPTACSGGTKRTNKHTKKGAWLPRAPWFVFVAPFLRCVWHLDFKELNPRQVHDIENNPMRNSKYLNLKNKNTQDIHHLIGACPLYSWSWLGIHRKTKTQMDFRSEQQNATFHLISVMVREYQKHKPNCVWKNESTAL